MTNNNNTVSPVVLSILGVTIGAASMILLFKYTTIFTPKEEVAEEQENKEVNNEIPSVNVTAEIEISAEAQIRPQVQAESGIPEKDMEFSMGDQTTTVARGTVKDKNDAGGAGWFASKSGKVWTVDYVGQGVPKCVDVEKKGYPTSWISHCETSTGTVRAL